MKIFAEKRLREVLSMYLKELDVDCIIVELEQPDEKGCRSTASGMNLVPRLAEKNSTVPIIIIGWQTVEMYEKYRYWQDVVKFKNVVLRRLPIRKDDILSAIAEVKTLLSN